MVKPSNSHDPPPPSINETLLEERKYLADKKSKHLEKLAEIAKARRAINDNDDLDSNINPKPQDDDFIDTMSKVAKDLSKFRKNVYSMSKSLESSSISKKDDR